MTTNSLKTALLLGLLSAVLLVGGQAIAGRNGLYVELGVVAHELGHVLHRDILISSVAATLAAAITMLARMAFWFGPRGDDDERGGNAWSGLLMMILAPFAAMLIQLAISRSREYDADAA